MLLSTVFISVLLWASTLVQAAPYSSYGGKSSISGLINFLKSRGLTALSNALCNAVKGEGGDALVNILNSGDVTFLAPNNDAFNSFGHLYANFTDILLYHVIYGTIETGFETPGRSSTWWKRHRINRNTGKSGYKTNGLKANNGKRWYSFDDNQVQVVDQFITDRRNSTILINRAVGDARVLKRFAFKNIDIFTIGSVLTIPTPVSDLLSKPLVGSARQGFLNFTDGLQKTGLLDTVDNGHRITIFAPTDDAFRQINTDGHYNEDLARLLKNHFSFGNPIYSPLFATTPAITTESGKKLELIVENGAQYVRCGDSRAQIRRSDVISSNGVLHVIDRVLQCDSDSGLQ